MDRIIRMLVFSATAFGVIGFSQPAVGGPYTDDLTRCIVDSTNEADRLAFIKWMFSAISKHPATKPMAAVTEKQQIEIDKSAARLFVHLLTESCREQTKKAIEFEGNLAIERSFNTLGQIAARDLFRDPDVAAAISNMKQYMDEDKLKSSLDIE